MDGVTGREIAWISGRFVLRPAALPAAYRLTEVVPQASLVDSPRTGPAGAVQLFRSPGTAAELEIAQSAGNVPIPGPGPGGWISIRIRGHAGLATRNLITWRENGLTDVISVLNGRDDLQVLTTGQLLAIADSAPDYNTQPLPVLR